jgi:hypothetical protein
LKRQPTQKQIEAAHRIRQISRGVQVEGATAAERAAAAKRCAAAQQQRRAFEADSRE